MTLRDVRSKVGDVGLKVGFYVRGRLSNGITRVLNRRGARLAQPPVPLDEVLSGDDSPFELARLLEGRTNEDRQAAVARYLEARSIPFARHRFTRLEGSGENFSVDVGSGGRVLILIAHHDAVPGCPGANDNAAAVGILLHLLQRVRAPAGLRVRFLFTAAEERGYLGARAYVENVPLAGVVGVLSLELCGIGDALAVWDAEKDTPFLQRVGQALEGLALRRDVGYHVVGRIPVFGSDHRAFAATGIPAYGLTIVPLKEAAALRRFVMSPMRSVLMHVVRRPVPFDTYHTPRDCLVTLEPAAMDMVVRGLEAIIAGLGVSESRR